MKICRSCREEFSDKVNKCLYCGGPLEIVSIPQQIPLKETVAKGKGGIEPGEIWKHYKIPIIIFIVLIVIAGILFIFSQKEDLNKSETQVIGTESLKVDAPVAPVREPALVTQPSPTLEPSLGSKSSPLPATVIYMYNDAVSLCPGANCTDPQKAVALLNEAVRLRPDFADAYGARGNAYSNMKQYQSALDDYSKAIQLENDNAIFFNNRGNVYKELNKYQQAIGDYNEAIRLKPDDLIAYYNRGNIYFIQGDQKTGCDDAQKACEMGNCKLLDFGKEKKYCH
jgi:tetratricopeptide (TPR) repeat protein